MRFLWTVETVRRGEQGGMRQDISVTATSLPQAIMLAEPHVNKDRLIVHILRGPKIWAVGEDEEVPE